MTPAHVLYLVRPQKLLRRIRAGHTNNVRFGDLVRLLCALGLQRERIKGSHQIFSHRVDSVSFAVQPYGGKAKPYQLRELLGLIERYNWDLDR